MVSRTLTSELVHGKIAANEADASVHIPYTRHVDDYTLATKNGYYVQFLKVDGFSFETADQIDVNARKEARATMLRGLSSSRFAIYHHIVRREVDQYPAGIFENKFCENLDHAYRERIEDRRMFVNEQYISLVRRPSAGAIGFVEKIKRSLSSKIDKEAIAEIEAADLKALNDGVKKLMSNLGRYGAKRLGMKVTEDGTHLSEPLSLIGFLTNFEMRDYRIPRGGIDKYVATKRISFGKETLEVRGAAEGDVKIAAVASVASYDPVTQPEILNNVLRIPSEFILTQSFGFIDRQATLSMMSGNRKRYESVEEDSVTLLAQLDQAIDEVSSGRSSYGEHHLTITPIAKTANELDETIGKIDAALGAFGIITKREDLNTEPAFWAQLPGNFAYIARRSPISTHNFSSFASLHTFPSGKLHGNWWGEPISLLETTSGSPYWFSFHDRDVGNFTLIGPTGAGKTVLMSFLAAQAQRVAPRTVIFDKDRGAEIFVRAIGGTYTVVRPGTKTGYNPLRLPDTPDNRAFLREWLGVLVTVGADNKALSSTEEAVISDAVKATFELEPKNRTISELAPLLSGFELSDGDSLFERLEKWYGDGDYAWLFDNEEDILSLDNRTVGFDCTSILDDPVARVPWLLYVFHRVDALLKGYDDEGNVRTNANNEPIKDNMIILLDEGWKLVDDPIFAARIKDWEKTIRKMNGLLGFATQSVGDIFNSTVGTAIVEQSPTNIFLPNPRADKATYVDGFGLSIREFTLIRQMPIESRCFLVRHGNDSVVAKLDLGGLDEFIGVLSGRTETVNLVEELRNVHGDDPDAWLPIFMERMKK